jgi:MFS family permease
VSDPKPAKPEKTALPPLSRDFRLLWTGQTVSVFGDRVTMFVVPALMVFVLHASAFQIGLVSTAQYLPIPVLSLVAGGLVDRWPLRRLLIACDLLRFVSIGLVPLAWWLGFLSVPLLFWCVLALSVGTVFFNVGYIPACSSIVPAENLVRANSRLEGSRTVSEVAGPGLGGLLYAAMGAFALVVDAASYVVSACMFFVMKPFGTAHGNKEPLRKRLAVGVRLNWTDPVLRRSTAGTLLANIGGPIFVTQMPVLAYQGLHMKPSLLGTVTTVAAIGSVIGALVAPAVSRRVGRGRILGASMVLHSASGLGLLAVPHFPAAIVIGLTLASYGLFFTWYNINSQSVRQARAPIRDQAVIHGAYRTVTWGIIPVSTFFGGLIVTTLAHHMSILSAAKITMLVATVIGISSIIPLAGTEPPPVPTAAVADPATLSAVDAGIEGLGPDGAGSDAASAGAGGLSGERSDPEFGAGSPEPGRAGAAGAGVPGARAGDTDDEKVQA